MTFPFSSAPGGVPWRTTGASGFAALKLGMERRRLSGRLPFLVRSPYFPHQFVKFRL